MRFSIPKRNNEILLVPTLEEIPEKLEGNRELISRYSFRVGDRSFQSLRGGLRRKIFEKLGIKEENVGAIASAHQPGFIHPGIMFKHKVLEHFASKYFALNVIIDCDAMEALTVKIPFKRDRKFDVAEVVILKNDRGVILESIKLPSRERLDRVYEEIEKLCSSLRNDKIFKSYIDFLAIHNEIYGKCANLSELLTSYRRRYYPTPDVYEIFISFLCKTDEFHEFAADIISNLQEFSTIYNACLETYRKEHKLRYNVNPFPNLKIEGNAYEVPFWYIDDAGKRHLLFLELGNRKWLRTYEKELIAFNEGEDIIDRLNSLQLRPKAAILTMFLRMFVADIFIHGTTGGNYDMVTNSIIENYYGCRPPEYIVATQTKFLPFEMNENLEVSIKKLKEKLRSMRHNPDRYVAESHPLVAEKREILKKSRGKVRKDQHFRLQAVRDALVEEIGEEIQKIEKELSILQEKLEERDKLISRDFPYFLYPLSTL